LFKIIHPTFMYFNMYACMVWTGAIPVHYTIIVLVPTGG